MENIGEQLLLRELFCGIHLIKILTVRLLRNFFSSWAVVKASVLLDTDTGRNSNMDLPNLTWALDLHHTTPPSHFLITFYRRLFQ
ncbi:hypothetical protein J6590_028737 [Homalodisca vitripennis]|nr:hypothetical protein J6590_028737 [Homalodisca vitripennis]